MRPAIASDGHDILVAYTDTWGAYAVLLDADGAPRDTLRRILIPPVAKGTPYAGPLAGIRAVWLQGIYGVFLRDRITSETVIVRLTRDAEVIDIRRLPVSPSEPYGMFDVAAAASGVVAAGSGSRIAIFDHELELTATITVPPTPGSRAVAGNALRHAILTADDSAVTLRLLDARTRLSAPVTLAGATANRDLWRLNPRLVWAGTEYVAAWGECGRNDPARTCSTWLVRLTPHGVPKAPPQQLTDRGRAVYIADAALTALGEDRVLVAYLGNNGSRLRRFSRGVPLDAEPITRSGGSAVEALQTAKGLLLTVDNFMRAAFVPPPGDAMPVTLASTPISFTVVAEVLMGAGLSGDQIGVLRHRSDDGYHTHELAYLGRDGRMSAERHHYYSGIHDAVVVNAGSLYYWGVFPDGSGGMLKAFGDHAIHLYLSDGVTRATAAWTPPYLSTIWYRGGARLERWKGFRASPCELPAASVSLTTPPEGRRAETLLLAAGNEVWVLIAGAEEVRLTRVDTTPEECVVRGLETIALPAVRFPLVASWQQETETLAIVVQNGVVLRRRDGTVSIGPAFETRSVMTLAPAGRHFIALYDQTDSVEAMLLDENGTLLDTARVSAGTNGSRSPLVLVPVDGRTVLALYTRSIAEPPYHGVRRIGARLLTIEGETTSSSAP